MYICICIYIYIRKKRERTINKLAQACIGMCEHILVITTRKPRIKQKNIIMAQACIFIAPLARSRLTF